MRSRGPSRSASSLGLPAGPAARAGGALAAAAAVIVVSAGPATATWDAGGTGADGSSTAASVNRPAGPTVVRSGASAVVSWTATTLTGGSPATGYAVRRQAGATTTTVCSTSAPTLTCADVAPVPGTATYGVVAVFQGWSSQESPTTSFALDSTAPTTTASASGAANAAGWISAASSTVTVSATDAESGVASVSYRVGTGSWTTVAGASTSFAASSQGTTTVGYYATDNAANVATTKTLTVKLDNVAPTVAGTYPPSGNVVSATWNGNCRNAANAVANGLCGSSADATSGVTTVEYLLSRTPLLGGANVCWNSSSQSWTNGACSSYRAAAQGPSGIASWYIPLPAASLGTGDFDLRVRVTDTAGNVSSVTGATRTFAVTA
jgi:hypothetical protein